MALVPAILYKDEIKKQILYHTYDDEMFLYTGSNGFSTPEISDEGEGVYQYAIVDDKKLIGYFSYVLDMYSSNANCFSLFSFDKGNPIIGISVFRELEKLINSFHVHRLEWRMIEGNPVERHYDRFCQKYNGKKHILKDAIRDKQGVYHADVIYEIIFDAQKTHNRSNADTIREFVFRFKREANETTTTLLGTSIVTYRISPEELEKLMDNMIAEVIGEDSMKAWIAKETVNFGATVVFAETRDKAKSLALCTSCCKDANFCDIEVRRVPQMDKYYVEGKTEMDWFDPADRIALVKKCGFYCRHPIAEDCKDCPAKEFCDKAVTDKEIMNYKDKD